MKNSTDIIYAVLQPARGRACEVCNLGDVSNEQQARAKIVWAFCNYKSEWVLKLHWRSNWLFILQFGCTSMPKIKLQSLHFSRPHAITIFKVIPVLHIQFLTRLWQGVQLDQVAIHSTGATSFCTPAAIYNVDSTSFCQFAYIYLPQPTSVSNNLDPGGIALHLDSHHLCQTPWSSLPWDPFQKHSFPLNLNNKTTPKGAIKLNTKISSSWIWFTIISRFASPLYPSLPEFDVAALIPRSCRGA